MDRIVARKLRPWEGRKLDHVRRQLSNTVNSRHARIALLYLGGLSSAAIASAPDAPPPGFDGPQDVGGILRLSGADEIGVTGRMASENTDCDMTDTGEQREATV